MARLPVRVAERLRPPRRASDSIERAFLLERVRNGLDGQAVLLVAPAGFGKTELMASLFQAPRAPGELAAWLTLDPGDADPDILGADIGHAFGFVDPVDGAETLLEALAALPARRLLLFLDGVEAAHASSVGELLRRAPDRLRFVLSARGDTGLSLSRLRMRQLLTELTATDLAFSRSETRRLAGQHLAPAEFGTFHQAIAGWPAPVCIAASRFGAALTDEVKTAFVSGTHHEHRLFLREELFPSLPPDAVRFLRASAFLDEVPLALGLRLADLSATLSIDALQLSPPLLGPVPQRAGWVAMHPLLRAAIAEDNRDAGIRPDHAGAALWFAADGQIERAVHHAGQAGDFAFAAETIRAAGGVDLFLRVGYTVLHRLMRDIPAEIVHRSPSLRLCAALVLAKEGQVQSAREGLEELKALAKGSETAEVPEAVLTHIDSLVDIYEDRHFEPEQIEWLEARVRAHRLKDTWERGWLHNHLCIAHTRQGQLRLARLHALKALDCYREEGAAYAQAFMLIHLSLVNLLSGRIHAATGYSRQAEDLIQRTQWSDENLLAIARVPMAETLYQQGRIRAADAMLAEALPIVARGEGWVDVFARGFVTLARCRRRLEGTTAALAVADRAEEVAEDRGLDRLSLAVTILRVEILTRAALFEAASDVAARLPDPGDEAVWPARRENRDARIALARLALRRGDAAGAADALARFVATSLEEDDALNGLTVEILLAEAFHALGDLSASLAHLKRAVAAAQAQDLTEPFAAEGEPFTDVVRAIVRRSGLTAFDVKSAGFVNRVVAIGNDGTPAPKPGMLSAREADVLALLAAGRSNKEIAKELGITEATAKFHLKNLFAKLGASRRTMAVSVATAMGLLASA